MKITADMYMVKNFYETKLRVMREELDNDMYIDDHNGELKKPAGLAVLMTGDVCPIFNSRYFSLNPLVEGRDFRIHLSRCSTGGVVQPMYYNNDIGKAISAYNAEMMRYPRKQIAAYILFEEE